VKGGDGTMILHKRNLRAGTPVVSIVLLDWSCRERFHALDWLSRQNVPREQFEIIWVELFERVVQKAMEDADVVITCGQKGPYHKHSGYNEGLLAAKGEILTVCDSDAVFPPDFVASIIESFHSDGGRRKSLVLMHYERRGQSEYPPGLNSIDELSRYQWADLWPNVGACMSVTRADAIRFGGFDEHYSYRGYICGPYDLGWRLVNAGIPEIWHDEKVALWHFAHPIPAESAGDSWLGALKRWREVGFPHMDYHALTAVESFSTGRLLPLEENRQVHCLRMSLRQIGTKYEEKYATQTGPRGFSWRQKLPLRLRLIRETLIRLGNLRKLRSFLRNGRKRYPPAKKDFVLRGKG
jgi:GT2 family glycosyltransferase